MLASFLCRFSVLQVKRNKKNKPALRNRFSMMFSSKSDKFDTMKLCGALDIQKGSQSYLRSASDCIVCPLSYILTIA